MDLPWWTLSPSPFTIIFYLILITYTMRKLKHRCMQERNIVSRFADSFFLVGFIILFLDSFWILACLLRFGWLYPNSILQLLASLGRNLAGIALCCLFIRQYLGRIMQPTIKTFIIFLVNISFLVTWFILSPSPAYTDWTFAIRNDYSSTTVALSFFTSHIIGKTIAGLFYSSYWK